VRGLTHTNSEQYDTIIMIQYDDINMLPHTKLEIGFQSKMSHQQMCRPISTLIFYLD